MGAVPLLTRDGEVELARRMERGKLKMQKAISRSVLVHLAVLQVAEQMKLEDSDLGAWVDIGDVEEGTTAHTKRQADIRRLFGEFSGQLKRQHLAEEKQATVPASNKKLRRKAQSKFFRTLIETSLHIRRVPWLLPKWRQFSLAIEKAAEEMAHLD
ncbi:RNA polymerase sigma factor RpoD, partial [bacterium]|nr:RNA polymerase sigma factor RpoD [bacterium]